MDYNNDETQIFESDTIILATGQRVDVDFLGEKFASQIKSKRGLLEVDMDSFQTKNEKIYAGGDAVTGPNIAIRAINAGGRAAHNISEKLGFTIPKEKMEETGFLTFDKDGIKNKEGAKNPEVAMNKRTLTGEDAGSLTKEQAEAEAGRCMNCGCYSVNASDISPVLMALKGTIVTTKKEIAAADFFTTELQAKDMLDRDELVTAVRIQDMLDYITGYDKIRIRTAIDFALVSLAYAYKLEDGKLKDIRLVLGGVAPVPVELYEVESLLTGKAPNEEIAKEASKLALKNAHIMENNEYKAVQVKVSLERLISSIGK